MLTCSLGGLWCLRIVLVLLVVCVTTWLCVCVLMLTCFRVVYDLLRGMCGGCGFVVWA